MKIAIYAICKNESKHIDRFMDSISDADEIVILDTGSSDNSFDLFQKAGAKIHKKIFNPWRFDDARNECLSHVSNDIDICISLDIDEILRQGWRKLIEDSWNQSITRFLHDFIEENGKPYLNERIHSRHGYEWRHMVHEILYPFDCEHKVYCEGFTIEHWPDRSKSRSIYLPLLELEVFENPKSSMHQMWLMHEWMIGGHYEKLIRKGDFILDNHQKMWSIYRSMCYGYISVAHRELGHSKSELNYLFQSCVESPNWRDGWYYLSKYYQRNSQWERVISTVKQLLATDWKVNISNTLDECWSSEPILMLAQANWMLGFLPEASRQFKIGINQFPHDKKIAQMYGDFLSKTNPPKYNLEGFDCLKSRSIRPSYHLAQQ